MASAPRGFGWRRDLPDSRDYTPQSESVGNLLAQLTEDAVAELPQEVDLREFFPAAYDQRQLHSSTTQACVGLVEYFQRRCHGNQLELSRLFHYQTTRELLGLSGNTATDIRTGLKAIARFGLPPERYWPYDVDRLDTDPRPQLFAFAESYRTLVYFRLDDRNLTGVEALRRVKAFLAANIPVAFGFSVPSSDAADGVFLYRPEFDFPRAGHTVIAVGYDDEHLGVTKGALLVRNSWGPTWGEGGYGWVPYPFVTEQLAADFWIVLRRDWIESGELLRPALDLSRPEPLHSKTSD